MAIPAFGVVYVAFGRPYLAMTLNSISSLRLSNPGTPVCVITNVAKTPPNPFPWTNGVDSWIFVDKPSNQNREIKTSVCEYSPFEKTVFLDCDTVILRSIAPAAFFLDHFDVALRMARRVNREDSSVMLFNGSRPCGEFPTWNSGVVMFRRGEAVNRFFRAWTETFNRLHYPRDQPALVEALVTSGCRMLTLDNRWNNSDSVGAGLLDSQWFRQQTIIWHYKQYVDSILRQQIQSAEAMIDGATHQSASEMREFFDQRRHWVRHGPLTTILRRVRGRLGSKSAEAEGGS